MALIFWNIIPKRNSVTAKPYRGPERDKIFNFSGLELLLKRYVIRTGEHIALETPQEMYLGIALHLAMKENRETE